MVERLMMRNLRNKYVVVMKYCLQSITFHWYYQFRQKNPLQFRKNYRENKSVSQYPEQGYRSI